MMAVWEPWCGIKISSIRSTLEKFLCFMFSMILLIFRNFFSVKYGIKKRIALPVFLTSLFIILLEICTVLRLPHWYYSFGITSAKAEVSGQSPQIHGL